MFIYNVKINGSKIFKFFFTFLTLLLIFILVLVTYKVFYGAKNDSQANSSNREILYIKSQNYTNVLKTVHDNIDDYIGMKINFSGYIYILDNFKDNQFVLARNMIISSDFNYVVVGFLCEYDGIKKFQDYTWVDVTGYITKGDYNGEMPIVKVTKIKAGEKPNEEFVYPPDDNYISTISWI